MVRRPRVRLPRNFVVLIVVSISVALFPLLHPDENTQHILFLVLLYAGLGQAWNLLGGFTGLVSLGNAVFLGIGAYTSTILTVQFGISPLVGMIAGAGVAVLVALLIAVPTLRLKGHYFAIATIAISEVVIAVVINTEALGGAVGFYIPILPEGLINMQYHSNRLPFVYVALSLAVFVFAIVIMIQRARFGYYLRAIKSDELAARSMGVAVFKYKLYAFLISAALTAMGGTIYAQYVMVIEPTSVFPFMLSVQIALVTIVGGVGYVWGPALGAAILIPMSELSRQLFGGQGTAADQLLYGGLIVLLAVFRPGGLMSLVESVPGWRRSIESKLKPLKAGAKE